MPYAPNDSNLTPDSLAFLHSLEGALLLNQVISLVFPDFHHSLFTIHHSPTVSQITRLRKAFPAPAVHAALTLAQLQPKARQKFPNLAQGGRFIYAIPEALEQATDSAVAAHKASRFAQANPTHIYDLCCGIGGDALALANIAPTIAIDLSAPRLTCLRYNLENHPTQFPLQTLQADVVQLLASGSWLPASTFFHIDPARRWGGGGSGKRSAKYQDLIPAPAFLEKLIHSFPGGAIKLSPAVDFASLPPGHLEIISHNNIVVQAVLYVGTLATQNRTRSVSEGSHDPPIKNQKSKIENPPTRTATLFKNHHLLFTYTATPESPVLSPSFTLYPLSFTLPAFLYESDPALTRSQLAYRLALSLHLTPLTSDAGYLLGQGGEALPPHPALTPFQLLHILPYSESKLIQALQNPSLPPTEPGSRGGVEVKTRGKIPGLDTDRLQVLLSKSTPHKRTVFIFRHGRETLAALAHRIA